MYNEFTKFYLSIKLMTEKFGSENSWLIPYWPEVLEQQFI